MYVGVVVETASISILQSATEAPGEVTIRRLISGGISSVVVVSMAAIVVRRGGRVDAVGGRCRLQSDVVPGEIDHRRSGLIPLSAWKVKQQKAQTGR